MHAFTKLTWLKFSCSDRTGRSITAEKTCQLIRKATFRTNRVTGRAHALQLI